MALRSGVGIIKDLDEEKGKKKTVERTVRGSKIKDTSVGEKEVGGFTSMAAAIPSGIIKTVEGVVSLSAELMDLGAGTLVGLPSTKGSTVSAAQEVEEFLPEVVHTDAEGMKSVAYGNISGLLIEAIKEQQKTIEHLQKQITDLQNKNS